MRLVTKGVRSDLEQDFGGVRAGLSRRPELIHVKIASNFEKPHKRFLSSAVRPAVMVERPLQLNSEFQPSRLGNDGMLLPRWYVARRFTSQYLLSERGMVALSSFAVCPR